MHAGSFGACVYQIRLIFNAKFAAVFCILGGISLQIFRQKYIAGNDAGVFATWKPVQTDSY